MLTEKKIYDSWRRRFAYPISPIESAATTSLRSIRKIKPLSKASVRAKIQKTKVVFVGDDAFLNEHKKTLAELIRFTRTLVITNRNFGQIRQLQKTTKLRDFHLIRSSNIAKENTEIEKQIEKNVSKYDRIVIWTGHLRISLRNFRKKYGRFNPLFIALQSNELRWKFPKTKDWIQVDSNFFANVSPSPLISIDAYRATHGENSGIEIIDAKKEFLLLQKKIAKNLGQKKYIRPSRMVSVFDRNDLERLKFSKPIQAFINQRMLLGESAILPRQKMVLLSTQVKSHIAEEAAHYLRIAHRAHIEYGKPAIIVEEAMAFFASLLLFPMRPIPKLQGKKNDWDDVHATGYALGLKLWKIWSRSAKSRPLIKKLWNMYPSDDGEFGMMLSILLDLR